MHPYFNFLPTWNPLQFGAKTDLCDLDIYKNTFFLCLLSPSEAAYFSFSKILTHAKSPPIPTHILHKSVKTNIVNF